MTVTKKVCAGFGRNPCPHNAIVYHQTKRCPNCQRENMKKWKRDYEANRANRDCGELEGSLAEARALDDYPLHGDKIIKMAINSVF